MTSRTTLLKYPAFQRHLVFIPTPQNCAALIAVLVFLAAISQRSFAQNTTPPSPEVAAARADAMEMLRQDVLAAHIQPDITVQMVVEKTGGEAMLNKALASAHQVGGPRWLDAQVAQIRVEV